MNSLPLTARGAERLREELKRLKKVERPRIIDAIAEARAHGDLSENAEYHAAREEQGFIEGRIKELDSSLGLAQVIDPTVLDTGGRIVFGATVELFNIATEEEVTYQIVGDLESDIEKSRISISSPIARALIGKEVDDEVDVKTPGGVITYEILSVKYI
jgi:transcription elongation factor GreA